MQAFQTLTSHVIPLPMKDVDTDMIIPAQFLTQTSREGYGEALFIRLKQQDKNFVFNQEKYQGANILLSGENFGCGSSREHAVWALLQGGIKVVIAESFSDILFNNAAKNGLLLIALPQATIASLSQQSQAEGLTLTVDLSAQTITHSNGEVYAFDYDPFRKDCLLQGNDDLDYLLDAMPTIDNYLASNKPVWES